MIRPTVTWVIIALLLPACARAASDPNWPCQQIKVQDLSLAAVWSGPTINPDDATWKDDPMVVALVQTLAPRRESIDQAKNQIREFAARGAERKQPQLLQIMVGLFAVMNEERASVIAGLERFGTRQRQLAADIRADNQKLQAQQADAAADPIAVKGLTDKVRWEVEVFQDRRQAVSYACDVPTKIEQRLFALAHAIQREVE